MEYLFAAIALAGHWSVGIFIINRLHSTALPYRLMKVVDLLWYGFMFAIPATVAAAYFAWPGRSDWLLAHPWSRIAAQLYLFVCCFAAIAAVTVWLRHLTDASTTPRLLANHTTRIPLLERLRERPTANWSTNLLSRLPRNQVFELWVQEKTVSLPRLDPTLSGLSIAHLSDLHFTGRVTKPFYAEIVAEANKLNADLMVISGDIIDKRRCFPWLVELLGSLRARHGVFFVLGNHDLRVRDELRLRSELTQCGLIDLGGRHQMIEVRERPILLAGNELPWFVPAADLRQVPLTIGNVRPLRIAVSHSPDQIEWSRSNDMDLMLAGHTHGGQIRFPLIGPVFAPSRYGVRYSAGTFYVHPTLMHVSRGLSGTRPLRFDCAPELVKLTLVTD